jgi:hypothetical protein
MLILFDQATPMPLRSFLKGHLVRTAAQQGWDRLKNGDLLNAADSAAFDLLITTDRNMPYQQHLAGRRIAVMVLTSQQWPELRPHVDLVIEALSGIGPGEYVQVNVPRAESKHS